jgi:hypothetical protein
MTRDGGMTPENVNPLELSGVDVFIDITASFDVRIYINGQSP